MAKTELLSQAVLGLCANPQCSVTHFLMVIERQRQEQITPTDIVCPVCMQSILTLSVHTAEGSVEG